MSFVQSESFFPGAPVLPAQRERDYPAVSWRERLLPRCSAPDCYRSRRLFPSYRRKASGILLDRHWFCSAACASSLLSLRVHNLVSGFAVERQRSHRLPLGLLLVNRRVISYQQLQEALRLQRDSRQGRLGSWLRQLGYVSDTQIAAALGQQWGCPVFPLGARPVSALLASLAPFTLFQSARAVPVHISSDGLGLHVAFSERMDHTLLYALEQMLHVRTFGCVATESSVVAALDSLALLATRKEICFDTMRDPSDISSTITSYATELRASRLLLHRAGSLVWTRFFRGSSIRDLLFRILPATVPISELPAASANPILISADNRKDDLSLASGLA